MNMSDGCDAAAEAGADPAADCGVLVIGSGAGGLAAAVTASHAGLKVIVPEKAPALGGATAWSGGWLWIARNPLALAAGIDEDAAKPRRYLAHETEVAAAAPRPAAFPANGPEMVAFFAAETEVAFIDGNRVPDFHAAPGSPSTRPCPGNDVSHDAMLRRWPPSQGGGRGR